MAVKNGLYKRGRSWYVHVKVNGTNVRKSFGSDKRAAELALAEVRKQRAVARASDDWSGLEKLLQPKEQKTFREAAQSYLAEKEFKPSTQDSYNSILKRYLLPEFGPMQISSIREEGIAKFQKRIRGHLSASRTNTVMQLFRSVMGVCHRRKIILDNPAQNVQRVREAQVNIDPLSRDELDAALSAIDVHYQPLFICLAWTGCRPNELLALRHGDIDWKRKQIHIFKGRVRGQEGLPKTSSAERHIVMLPPVEEAIKRAAGSKLSNLNGYIFTSKSGQPINKHLDRIWARALQKAKLRHRPSYQLRHTFASFCLEQGASPGWIAKMLGHSTMQTTFKHYLRFIKDSSAENERLLSSMFDDSDSKHQGTQKGTQETTSISA